MNYFKELQLELEQYLTPDQVKKCRKAYLFAKKAHEGQMRRSGEPYITHPIAAGVILAKMRLDYETIMATLLHDVVEDTPVTKNDLIQEFGEEVTALVDGVTKLTKIKFESKAEAQAENFRKMVLAMVKDIRVILVKLADRLHNMRTLGIMPRAKKKRIAIETLEIYAPIANRLGMHSMYISLEDLGFKSLYPMRYNAIKSAVEKARGNRLELMQKIETDLENALKKLNIPYKHVFGREKHLYGIYRKMKLKKSSFSEIMDVFAFRVVTKDIDACYRVLGALHQIYKPVPNKFKDYIGIPKINGYQSLHTILFGPFGIPLEVQIRTEEMDNVAENGVAAHWLYKTQGFEANEAALRAREWVQRLMEIQQHSTGNSLEFIEHVKVDLFSDEVYVFTPKGDIMELPKSATPIDFAYAVHSDIGNTCIAARVNKKLVPLSIPLTNGQTVEIIASKKAHPNPGWLNFVVTGKARSNIRNFLKNQHHKESIKLGQRLLEQSFNELNSDFNKIPKESMQALLNDLNFKNRDELLYAIGIGNQVPMLIAKRLVIAQERGSFVKAGKIPLSIKGTEGMVVHFAKCCQPIPNDNIVGVFQKGRGIEIHMSECTQLNSKGLNPEQYIALCWDKNVKGEFWVEITVEVENKRGVLAALATAISEAESNIGNISVDNRDTRHNSVTFSLTVMNRIHLARVIRRLRSNTMVLRIYRKKLGE